MAATIQTQSAPSGQPARRYKVIAQHELSAARIEKTVTATSEAEVLRLVSLELSDLQYYVLAAYPA